MFRFVIVEAKLPSLVGWVEEQLSRLGEEDCLIAVLPKNGLGRGTRMCLTLQLQLHMGRFCPEWSEAHVEFLQALQARGDVCSVALPAERLDEGEDPHLALTRLVHAFFLCFADYEYVPADDVLRQLCEACSLANDRCLGSDQERRTRIVSLLLSCMDENPSPSSLLLHSALLRWGNTFDGYMPSLRPCRGEWDTPRACEEPFRP
jgi:hypothetical protein